jgi:hypothetical protein
MNKTYLVGREKTMGDTAVDGLLAGLIGGVAMALFLLAAGWLMGTSPLATLAYFNPAQAGSWLTGLLAHLAVAAIYGVLFGLLLGSLARLRPSLWRWSPLIGAGYGLLLWLVGLELVATAVTSLGQVAAWQFSLAHLVYGVVVGFAIGKNGHDLGGGRQTPAEIRGR